LQGLTIATILVRGRKIKSKM